MCRSYSSGNTSLMATLQYSVFGNKCNNIVATFVRVTQFCMMCNNLIILKRRKIVAQSQDKVQNSTATRGWGPGGEYTHPVCSIVAGKLPVSFDESPRLNPFLPPTPPPTPAALHPVRVSCSASARAHKAHITTQIPKVRLENPDQIRVSDSVTSRISHSVTLSHQSHV